MTKHPFLAISPSTSPITSRGGAIVKMCLLAMAILIVSCSPEPSENIVVSDPTISPLPESTSIAAPTKTSTPNPISLAPTPTSTDEVTPHDVASPTQEQPKITVDNTTLVEPLRTLTGHLGPVTVVKYSPDGSLLASGSEDFTVRVWDAHDGSLLHELIGHTDMVTDLSFSPDGKTLASSSTDGSVRFWDVEEGSFLRTLEFSLIFRVQNIEFSPTGDLIALGGTDCFIEIRRVNTGILRRALPQPECAGSPQGLVLYWGIDFTSSGDEIITGDGRWCCGGSIQRWDVERYVAPTLLEGYKLKVRDLEISPDDSTLVMALMGSPVFWLVDTENGDLLNTFTGHAFRVNSVVYSPDGKLIASGSKDQTIGLWDLNGTLLSTLEAHSDGINSIAFSPGGSTIASASDDKTVILWGMDIEAE